MVLTVHFLTVRLFERAVFRWTMETRLMHWRSLPIRNGFVWFYEREKWHQTWKREAMSMRTIYSLVVNDTYTVDRKYWLVFIAHNMHGICLGLCSYLLNYSQYINKHLYQRLWSDKAVFWFFCRWKMEIFRYRSCSDRKSSPEKPWSEAW
jgi:hypothetical protein